MNKYNLVNLLISLILWLDSSHLVVHSEESVTKQRLVVKHQIGYHFKRSVNEVVQELFISRQLDLEPVLIKLQALSAAAEKLDVFCREEMLFAETPLSRTAVTPSVGTNYNPDNPEFTYFPNVGAVTYSEAKAKCQSYGMRLPEVYTKVEERALAQYLAEHKLSYCWAGLEPDLTTGFLRFVSTGIPIWKGYQKTVYNRWRDKEIHIDDVFERFDYSYLYGQDGRLHYMDVGGHLPISHGLQVMGRYYRNATSYRPICLIKTSVVCSPAYRGQHYDDLYRAGKDATALVKTNLWYYKPLLLDESAPPLTAKGSWVDAVEWDKEHPENHTVTDISAISNLQGWDNNIKSLCGSVSHRLREIQEENQSKMAELLTLVDIKMRFSNTSEKGNADRKGDPMNGKPTFQSGIKLIRDFIGLFRHVPRTGTIKKFSKAAQELEKAIQSNHGRIKEDVVNLKLLTSAIKDHSVPLSKLSINPAQLSQKISALANLVQSFKDLNPMPRVQVITMLSGVSSLAEGIARTLDYHQDMMHDIVHKSLDKMTSPYLLPTEVVKDVQGLPTLRSIGASIDQDYSRMQSCIVVDPSDDRKLLIIINAAATSHENLELVELVPVPFFTKDRANFPVLQSEFIVLNQLSMVYRELSPIEAEACMTGRCYITSMEKSVGSLGCGIAQYYGRHLDGCDYVSSFSNGMFVKAAVPDGTIFSFRETYSGQLFCQDNILVGSPIALTGVGTIYVPSGCTLSISDRGQHMIKVRGAPTHHMVESAADLILAAGSVSKAQIEPVQMKPIPSNLSMEETHKQLYQLGIAIELGKEDFNSLISLLWGGFIIWVFFACVIILAIQITCQRVSRLRIRITDILRDAGDIRTRWSEVERLKASVRFINETMRLEKLPNPSKFAHLTTFNKRNLKGNPAYYTMPNLLKHRKRGSGTMATSPSEPILVSSSNLLTSASESMTVREGEISQSRYVELKPMRPLGVLGGFDSEVNV